MMIDFEEGDERIEASDLCHVPVHVIKESLSKSMRSGDVSFAMQIAATIAIMEICDFLPNGSVSHGLELLAAIRCIRDSA